MYVVNEYLIDFPSTVDSVLLWRADGLIDRMYFMLAANSSP